MSWRGGLRRAIPWVVAVLGGFFLAYLLVAFVVFPSGVVPKDLKVPNVVGLDYDDAAQRIKQAGFDAERGESRFQEMAPKNTVLEQNPTAGSKEVAGAKVTLVTSAGQKMAQVPSVSGMSLDDAEKAVVDAGYTVGDVADAPSTQPRGAVLGTRPAAGTKLPTPNTVTLLVSTGPTVMSAPDVVGRTYDEAQLLLRQSGFTVGDVSTDLGGPPSGNFRVIFQSPPGGSQVARGSRIDLRLQTP